MLSDEDRRVAEAYEVARSGEDKYARYPRRYSYLIDPEGAVFRSYDVTDVAEHATDVLTDIEAEVVRRRQAAAGGDLL